MLPKFLRILKSAVTIPVLPITVKDINLRNMKKETKQKLAN